MRVYGGDWSIRAGGVFAALVLAALLAVPGQVHAQKPAAKSVPLDEEQRQLRSLEQELGASDSRRRSIEAEIATLESDRSKFETALIETTRKVKETETRISDAEKRVEILGMRENATKRSLQSRRAVVAEVLAALQRMGRKPPPALLVDPDDVLKAIRTSMLLGTLLPGMRAETEALVADLTELSRTRQAIGTEHQALETELASLGAERERLGALVTVRQTALGKAKGNETVEREKAAKVAQEAGSLKDLIGNMERGSAAAGQAAEAARKSDEKLASLMPNGLGGSPTTPFKDPARLAPAIAFASTKGLLSRPVSGPTLRRYGEDDGLGGSEKGELVSTRTGAIVSAPSDGWVAYAGPYRSFGKLLILNAGGGYYIVLAGMERINVDLGQFVLAGEPVAAMGNGSVKTAAAIALGVAQPVLYVEFRKDGATIDPGPWWAKPELQKVRG